MTHWFGNIVAFATSDGRTSHESVCEYLVACVASAKREYRRKNPPVVRALGVG